MPATPPYQRYQKKRLTNYNSWKPKEGDTYLNQTIHYVGRGTLSPKKFTVRHILPRKRKIVKREK